MDSLPFVSIWGGNDTGYHIARIVDLPTLLPKLMLEVIVDMIGMERLT